MRPRPAREAAAYLSSYFLGGRGHKARLTEAVHNAELPRMPLYVSRRLTRVTKTTMRNKRRQRHAWVCRRRGRGMPAWKRPGDSGGHPRARRTRGVCGFSMRRSCGRSSGRVRSVARGLRRGSGAAARDATHTAGGHRSSRAATTPVAQRLAPPLHRLKLIDLLSPWLRAPRSDAEGSRGTGAASEGRWLEYSAITKTHS